MYDSKRHEVDDDPGASGAERAILEELRVEDRAEEGIEAGEIFVLLLR